MEVDDVFVFHRLLSFHFIVFDIYSVFLAVKAADIFLFSFYNDN